MMVNLSANKARYQELFRKLDIDSDGKIDVNDLVHIFEKSKNDKEYNIKRAQELILRSDKEENGSLNFADFVRYMIDHENRLELVFKGIDTNNDNKIGHTELIGYFKKLGVEITTNEARKLVEKINKNGSLMIEPNEWKDYFFLAPFHNIDDPIELLHHWRYSTVLDLGEGSVVPDEFLNIETRSSLWYRNLVAGAVAGAVSRTCTAPFDRLKIVMQVLGSRKEIKIIGGLRYMLNEGGVTSLWRGNGINVVKIAPEAAIKFAFYEELKLLITGKDREATMGERFMAGSVAGCMAQSLIYPLEVLKTRLVLRRTGEYSSIFDCANKIIRNEGVRAFYKGFLPNVLGIIPYAGCDLAVYETLKRFYMKRYHMVDNPSTPILLICGTTSTICGQLVSYPLSLIRTRLQAQEVPMDSTQRDTMSKLMIRIWRNEGIRGMYRGLLPNIIKVVPAVSISYVVYENMKKKLLDPS